jgi:uncharacterized protein (DUF1330 family)
MKQARVEHPAHAFRSFFTYSKGRFMSAYVIAIFTPQDLDKLREYSALATPTIARYSGEMLVKGQSDILHGNPTDSMTAVIQFPSKELASAWYASAEYQAIISVRDAGMHSQFRLIG